MKRGQVTIFIIIGVLIIALVLGFLMIKGDLKIFGGVPASIEPFYVSFTSCFEETAKEGIYYTSKHGGYYNVPFNSSIIYFTEEIPYYYLGSKNYTPSLNIVEEELEKYISSNLENCLDLESFREQGFNISEENYSISTKIKEKNVKIKMLNSLTITKGDDTTRLKDIELNLEYDIKNLHTTSREIVDMYSQKPGYICLTCLDYLSNKYNVNIEATPVTDVSIFENDIIWFFITNKDDISEDKLTWVFIVEQ